MQDKVESTENLERYLFQDASGLSGSEHYAQHVCKARPLLGIGTLRIIGSPKICLGEVSGLLYACTPPFNVTAVKVALDQITRVCSRESRNASGVVDVPMIPPYM